MELLKLKGDFKQLAEGIGARIGIIETNVSASIKIIFQEVRDIREYTRNVIQGLKDDIAKNGSGTTAIGMNLTSLDKDINSALVDKVETLYSQTAARFEQMTLQSRDAWNGLHDRISALEMNHKSLNFGLESEIKGRCNGDEELKNYLQKEFVSMLESRVTHLTAKIENLDSNMVRDVGNLREKR